MGSSLVLCTLLAAVHTASCFLTPAVGVSAGVLGDISAPRAPPPLSLRCEASPGGVSEASSRRKALGRAASLLLAAAWTREKAEARTGTELPENPYEAFPKVVFEEEKDGFDGVRSDVLALLREDRAFGPTLVRLGFHTSGTYDRVSRSGGSGRGTIRFQSEISHEANAGLKAALERLEPLKARHPDVSYGDLYTLAAAVAVEALGGPHVPWRGGRTDSLNPRDAAPDGRLPDPDRDYGDYQTRRTMRHLRDVFGRMGFNDQELVCLSGAHTVGQGHLEDSGFVGVWSEVPLRFDNAYFNILLQPMSQQEGTDKENWLPTRQYRGKVQYNDPNEVYAMLPSDLALIRDQKTRPIVEYYADNQPAFFRDFAAAYGKLLALGTGQDLEKTPPPPPYRKRPPPNIDAEGNQFW